MNDQSNCIYEYVTALMIYTFQHLLTRKWKRTLWCTRDFGMGFLRFCITHKSRYSFKSIAGTYTLWQTSKYYSHHTLSFFIKYTPNRIDAIDLNDVCNAVSFRTGRQWALCRTGILLDRRGPKWNSLDYVYCRPPPPPNTKFHRKERCRFRYETCGRMNTHGLHIMRFLYAIHTKNAFLNTLCF
jgi:hypothetical protein